MKLYVNPSFLNDCKILFPEHEIIPLDYMADTKGWIAKISEDEFKQLFPKSEEINRISKA